MNQAILANPCALARVRSAPSRAFAALFTFGGMLGVPFFLGALGAALTEIEPTVSVALLLLAGLWFFGFVVVAWILIFRARAGLKRAEAALYAGDFESATREAHLVMWTVFRADYQMGALFTLALAAERMGAFVEGGALFARALGAVPVMAAGRPGRRARALFSAHAAIDFAAANDIPRANEMIVRCQRELGAIGQPGALEGLLDDSNMGAIGINSMLVELENRREPRPLCVLAALLLNYKTGLYQQALQMTQQERPTLEFQLAPHERALAERIQEASMKALSGQGPHRSSGAIVAAPTHAASWADLIVRRA